MRKSLTRADVLRRKSEIAGLFPHSERRRPGRSRKQDRKQVNGGGRRNQAGAAPLVPKVALSRWTAESLEMALSETIRSPAPGSKTLGLVGSMRESGLRLSFVARPQAVVRDKVFISPANRLGSAVQRNHAKRLQREFYRHSRDRLRELSRQAAEAACRKFVGDWEHSPGVSFGDTILGTTCLHTACLHFEQSLSYHWGLVVCREAAEAEYDERKEGQTLASDSLSAVFWPGARNPAFVVELQRYENLLESLRRPMSGQWLRLLQRAFCDKPSRSL